MKKVRMRAAGEEKKIGNNITFMFAKSTLTIFVTFRWEICFLTLAESHRIECKATTRFSLFETYILDFIPCNASSEKKNQFK